MALVAPTLWEPSADEGRVRRAAELWRGTATRLDCTLGDLAGTAALVRADHEGESIDAFDTWWTGLAGPGDAHLGDLVAACGSVADALDAYADALGEVRRALLEIAASIAASMAVGVALAWATAGASAAAATATLTALTIQATALGATFAARAGTIARAVALHATIGALEGLATYAIVEPLRIAAFHPNDDPFGSFELNEAALAAAGGALVPGWRATRGTRSAANIVAPSSEELLAELARAGVKHDPSQVVAIRRLGDGRIVFLETGDARAGLRHIRRHERDFANIGITPEEIPLVVMEALVRGTPIGVQGRTRQIFQVVFRGEPRRIAVEVGSNGFVVSANPKPLP